ncbi:SCO family protein [Panacibacter ginsenosidivorans]|uniref:SCO family protein n=1 Tax=Panacibacter ginsenosidivorans TaxID=1813871 RepID=A0A5B8VCP0_9BACT|nr:SCO family protein [Panacibacter ginsenosidivorans]QEC68068.1 SCO family protein [Panacibacter ginsenosidivorans]
MKKKFIGYSIFFVILTGLFLLFSFWGTDNWRAKSPIISNVKPFTFLNQDGKDFTEKDMQGKVVVVNFFFTTCKGICPKMNGNMHKIYDAFKDEPGFMIVSHTCDPETDSVPVIKHYADSLKIDEHKWVFLTGRKDSLYAQARNSYLLDDPKNSLVNINDQFLHTQFFALVDKNGDVRGQVYDGLKQEELDKLKDDIRTLLKEKANGTTFSNNLFGN